MQRFCFQAMGTTVECLLDAEPTSESTAALRGVEDEFRRLESLLSRFRADSELSALNRSGSLVAGPDLRRVVTLALDARERTAGRFDPTVHDALVAAGYDRSFDELAADAENGHEPSRPCGGRVRLDETGLIELEPGFRLDLGGIAKGDAVDRTCRTLGQAGPCLVNAGGDLAVSGASTTGPWTIGVEAAERDLTLAIEHGAVATSGRDRRRWTRSGRERHHLIDPRIGRPAESDLRTVTVVAPTAAEAEALAKSLYLAGATQAAAEASTHRVPCVLVRDDGHTILAGGLE